MAQKNHVLVGAGGAVIVSETGYRNEVISGVFLGESVPVTGAFAASETGADTCIAAGSVRVTGTLAASETGADTLAAAGTVQNVAHGVLAATESGADIFAAAGKVKISGSLAATEIGADAFNAIGFTITIHGILAAAEIGSDRCRASGWTPHPPGSIIVYPPNPAADASSLLIYQGLPGRAVEWSLTGSGTLAALSLATNHAGLAAARYTPGTIGAIASIQVAAGA